MFEDNRSWYYLTADELHAVVYGWENVIKPTPIETDYEKKCRETEGHYYRFGEILGMATIAIAGIIVAHLTIL
jgi:hypothetical protein